jgi:hypothetical protein
VRSLPLFNRTNIIHMTTSVTYIKYIIFNVQDYSVLDNNAVRPVIREG